MRRIDFLKKLLLGGTAAFLPGVVLPAEPPKTRDIYLDSLYIAGFQYYQGVKQEAYLKENDPILLKRQTENAYDYFAVEVYRENRKLGYLPRTDNKIIARMMDQGVEVKAKISSINPEAHPFRRVKIRVYLEIN